MKSIQQYLKNHAFQVYSITFLLITVPAIFMYMAAQRDATDWIWVLIGIVITGNVIVVLTP